MSVVVVVVNPVLVSVRGGAETAGADFGLPLSAAPPPTNPLDARLAFRSLAAASRSFLRASPGLALAAGALALYGLSLRGTNFGSAKVPLIMTPV